MHDALTIPVMGYNLGHVVGAALLAFLFGVAYERKLIATGQHSVPKRKGAGCTPEDATGPAARAR